MRPTLHLCAIAALTAAVLSACDTAPLNPASSTAPSPLGSAGPSNSAQTAQNAQLDVLARATAAALADPATAGAVHELAALKFDGDTNVLWEDLDAMFPSDLGRGTTFSTAVAARAARLSEGPGAGAISDARGVVEALDQAIRAEGTLPHLYWHDAETWDGRTAPLVAAQPVGVGEDEVGDVYAYDAAGRRFLVTGGLVSERPVVFIAGNERTDAEGYVLHGVDYGHTPENEARRYRSIDALRFWRGRGGNPTTGPLGDPSGLRTTSSIMTANSTLTAASEGESELGECDYSISCGGGGGGDTGGGGTGGGSTYAGYLHLNWVQFFRDYEGDCCFKGDPEFMTVWTRYDFNNQATTSDRIFIYSIQGEECDGQNIALLTSEQYPFPWRTDKYPTYHAQWFEMDGSALNTEVNLSANFQNPLNPSQTVTAGIKFKVDDGDDQLGASTVNVGDPTPNEYNSGAPNMKVTLQQ